MSRKQRILNLVEDLVGRMYYYDRKEDPELPVGSIQHAIDEGEITEQEIVDQFAKYVKGM